jgi:hypothetical protein
LFGKRVGRFEYASKDEVVFALADIEPLQESGGLRRRLDVDRNLEDWKIRISKQLVSWFLEYCPLKRP